MAYRKSDATELPPGQRERADFPRFGLPRFAKRLPRASTKLEITVAAEIGDPIPLTAEDLSCLPRRELEADFHCVTTWTARRLRWSGYALRDFLDLAAQRIGPVDGVSWIGLRGLDGYRASLPAELATRPDVLLADRLFGEPLGPAHGAPLRVVAPSHYGYKSVKHLAEVRLLRSRPPGSAGWREHPVGLVAEEQRVAHFPGWLMRWLLRPSVAPIARHYRRNSPGNPTDS